MPDIKCTKEEDKTFQSFKDECDINKIMKRFEKTGELPAAIKKEPLYGDFSKPLDYQEACNTVAIAEKQFAMLDLELRNRFENSPVKFLEFCSDPKNIEEMASLGLLKPEAVKRLNDAKQKLIDEEKIKKQKQDDIDKLIEDSKKKEVK